MPRSSAAGKGGLPPRSFSTIDGVLDDITENKVGCNTLLRFDQFPYEPAPAVDRGVRSAFGAFASIILLCVTIFMLVCLLMFFTFQSYTSTVAYRAVDKGRVYLPPFGIAFVHAETSVGHRELANESKKVHFGEFFDPSVFSLRALQTSYSSHLYDKDELVESSLPLTLLTTDRPSNCTSFGRRYGSILCVDAAYLEGSPERDTFHFLAIEIKACENATKAVAKEAAAAGRHVVVCKSPEKIQNALSRSKFTLLFKTPESALSSVSGPSSSVSGGESGATVGGGGWVKQIRWRHPGSTAASQFVHQLFFTKHLVHTASRFYPFVQPTVKEMVLYDRLELAPVSPDDLGRAVRARFELALSPQMAEEVQSIMPLLVSISLSFCVIALYRTIGTLTVRPYNRDGGDDGEERERFLPS